jgi:hypothetical protein
MGSIKLIILLASSVSVVDKLLSVITCYIYLYYRRNFTCIYFFLFPQIISFIKLKVQGVNEPPFHLQISSVGGFYPFETDTPRVPENLKG